MAFPVTYIRSLRVAGLAGGLAVLVGGVVLLGWVMDLRPLTQVYLGWRPMVPMTAVCFALAGLGLVAETLAMADREERARMWRRAGFVIGLFVALVGARRLVYYAFDWSSPIDMLGFTAHAGPGRMAVLAAVGALLSGWALMATARRVFSPAAQAVAAAVFFLGLTVAARYLYGGEARGEYYPISLPSALLFMVVGAGVFFARPDGGFVMLWNGDTPGSTLLRRLFPAALLVPLAVGWLRLQGERAGWYGLETGLAIFAMSNVVIFATLAWAMSSRLHREGLKGRETLEKLRFQEAILRETGHIAKVGGWSFDPRTGEGYWTEEVARIHELDPTDRTSYERGLAFYEGADRAKVEAAVRAAVEHGKPYDLEVKLKTAKENTKWVRTIGHPLRENGVVVRMQGSFQDITDQRLVKRRLATQVAVSGLLTEANSLAEAAPLVLREIAEAEGWDFGAVWSIDEATQALRCATVWQREGMALDALREMTLAIAFPRGRGLPGRVWESKAALAIPDISLDPNYPRAPLALAAGFRSALGFPIFLHGEVVGVVDFLSTGSKPAGDEAGDSFAAIGRQMGLFMERRKAEDKVRELNAELERRVAARTAELQAKNRELETFTYSVSHDLKAPLRGIDGYSRLLQEDYGEKFDEEGRRFLAAVRQASQQMGQLIDDLLAYSQLERRAMTLAPVKPRAVLEGLPVGFREEMEARGVEFVVDLPDEAVSADANGLSQVLRNLLDNALKFTRGSTPPRIEVGGRIEGGRYLLWVRDNGIGFEMKFVERIFDIFQRLHRAEDYPGTGVGLAIVRKAVERMGGRAWALGEPGRGATFFVELPLFPS